MRCGGLWHGSSIVRLQHAEGKMAARVATTGAHDIPSGSMAYADHNPINTKVLKTSRNVSPNTIVGPLMAGEECSPRQPCHATQMEASWSGVRRTHRAYLNRESQITLPLGKASDPCDTKPRSTRFLRPPGFLQPGRGFDQRH